PRGRARRAALRRRGRVMAVELLRTERLRKEFGGLVAVDDVDFTVPSGSIVSLIGPNGAGKTTFFNMLTGVYKPNGGLVHFDGQDMTGKPPHAFTQRGIGRTFQNIRLFQNMTALENVLVGMHVRLKGNLFEAIIRTSRVKKEEREARARARELLEYSGLRRKDSELGKNLSYGDQRRLEVARALATQPKLLLLDEPTAGMNPQETADFTAFVGRLREEQRLSVLLIEHDMRVVMGVSDRVTVLDYGGEIVTLIGANGAGKSTTLRSINGLNHPRRGTISYRGRDITHEAPHQVVKLGIAQSPEGRKLFPRMSVTENLEMGAFQRKDKAAFREDMDRVFELFPRLAERRHQKAGTMSGGEQQMCAIGRALMARPTLLMLDEPSMGLAPVFVERIFETIVEVNKQGTSILLVEQNALMALDVANRGYVLETGHVALADEAKALARNEQVRKTYLG